MTYNVLMGDIKLYSLTHSLTLSLTHSLLNKPYKYIYINDQPGMVRKAADVLARCRGLVAGDIGVVCWFSPKRTVPNRAHSSHKGGSYGRACVCNLRRHQASVLALALSSMTYSSTHGCLFR